jgi:hypothetical protein
METLLKCDNLQDVKELMIDANIENIMYGSFDNWFQFLQQKMKLDVGILSKNKEAVIEVFQRRNLLVHNNGIVNQRYLKGVGKSNYRIGDKILISEEYLTQAITMLKLIGLNIVFSLWQKHDKGCIDRANYFSEVSVECMNNDEWDHALYISERVLAESIQGSDEEWVARINRWICLKETVGNEMVLEEIENFEISRNSEVKPIYQLAINALKGENRKVFEALVELYPMEINEKMIMEWPVFKDWREDIKFPMYMANLMSGEKIN